MKTPFNFKIGADPEFLLFHGIKAIDAQKLIQPLLKNKNYTATNMGFSIRNYGEIGWDGASSTAEIRPTPSNDIEILTNNIKTLIGTLNKETTNIDYTTLSIGMPIGGHIHLETTPEIHNNQSEKSKLTKLIATFSMPIMATEHRISTLARLDMGYGKPIDIRWEAKGPSSTAEIRSISAEWLTSPKLTYATLAYYAVVWHEIKKRSKQLIKESTALKTLTHINAVHNLMLADYLEIEKVVVKNIKKLVQTFERYPEYKKEIDFIFNTKEVIKEKEKNGWNIVEGWKLPNQKKQPTKKELLSKKYIKEKIKQDRTPLELQENFYIPHNKDYKVNEFAEELKLRISVLGWKLNHEYFLFGLKKETEGFLATNAKEKTFYTIPNNRKKEEIIETSEKMGQHMQKILSKSVKIDPKTGKIRYQNNNTIIVGIPYNTRENNKFKEFIKLIWDIEENKIKAKKITEFIEPTINANKNNEEKNITETIENAYKFKNPYSSAETNIQTNEISLSDAIRNSLTEETP